MLPNYIEQSDRSRVNELLLLFPWPLSNGVNHVRKHLSKRLQDLKAASQRVAKYEEGCMCKYWTCWGISRVPSIMSWRSLIVYRMCSLYLYL